LNDSTNREAALPKKKDGKRSAQEASTGFMYNPPKKNCCLSVRVDDSTQERFDALLQRLPTDRSSLLRAVFERGLQVYLKPTLRVYRAVSGQWSGCVTDAQGEEVGRVAGCESAEEVEIEAAEAGLQFEVVIVV